MQRQASDSHRCGHCGDRHNAFEECSCPLCSYCHESSDGQSIEHWRSHLNDLGNFERFVGSHCMLCGQIHGQQFHCPCPQCHRSHTDSGCPGDISEPCALCNIRHDGNCVGYISRCCLLCGEVHDSAVKCPCPRCLYRHDGDNCRTLSCCSRCHRLHNGNCVQPCSRCSVWHGFDVCAVNAVREPNQRHVRLPRARMRNHAMPSSSCDLLPDSELPVPELRDGAPDRHDVGNMTSLCTHCGARFWMGERIECCFKGSLHIPEPDIPQSLQSLIMSTAVQRHLRVYNMAMSLASVGHARDGFPDGVFVLSGKSYHQIGTLEPNDGQQPSFAQIYALDTTAAADRRLQIFGDIVSHEVLSALHDELVQHNRLVSEFIQAVGNDLHELVWTSEDNIMGMQIGALLCEVGQKRSIVLKRHGPAGSPFTHCVEFIDDGHSLYHPLTYPLLFPTGARGWFTGMTRFDRDGITRRSVSLHDYGRYLLMHRTSGATHLQHCKQLSLEFYCDLWAQNEARRAIFHALPSQQAKYRMGRKSAIEDQLLHGGNVADASVPMTLPCSFVGSAKWYHTLYLDALTLPQRYHAPDLFITFTCNPKWPEISSALPCGDYKDHPDIVARVFWLKFKSMMKDIVELQIFGPVQAYVWRIEWQARGLPHVHLLVILANPIRTARQIDAIVSAEVPDPSLFPELYSIVQEFQIHTPCDRDASSGCRDNPKKQCKRYFPKEMSRETVWMSNRYPKYRRRGHFFCDVKGRLTSDDWVVPYNSFLSLKYRAHCNVEISSSIKSFKYVYKYVLKSPDTAVISINEIQAHLSGRILSAAEAVWRLLDLPLHKEYPSVLRLHIHLPDEHTVIFDPTGAAEDIHDLATTSTSTLLQWFLLNQRDPAARALAYTEVPERYVWHENQWSRRKKGRQLGRVYAVSPRNQELFALRRLLTVVRGATGWDDLLIVDGHCYSSFQDACGARGMLADDGDIIDAYNEIVRVSCSLENNRLQFALLLLNRQCQNVPQFFAMMSSHLVEGQEVNPSSCAEALWTIEDIMVTYGRSLTEADFGMQLPPRPAHMEHAQQLAMRRHMFDEEFCISQRQAILAKFTDEQQQSLDAVLSAVGGQSATNVFAILASAGCGKTLWVEGLTWTLRAQGSIVLNVAASALAATLLPSGSTAHSVFKIPIPTTSASYCGVKGTDRELIRHCKCICYDEVSMVGKDVADCLNRFLQDIMGNEKPFGGKVVVFLGDFKQLMPIAPGRRYPATVKDCSWWPQCRADRFTKNWRAAQNPAFCQFLEQVGNGAIQQIPVPDESRVNSLSDLISNVYGDDMKTVSCSRNMILAFTLQTCKDVNDACLAAIPGEAFLAHAHDDTKDNRQPDLYTDDYLASLPLHGVPLSTLALKLGARYMITKNYNPLVGACNGTLCELLQYSRNLCQVKIQSGIHTGRIICLPRCSCHVSRENSGLPFEFTRVQFPLIAAYCVSVHKSQGQSLTKIGVIIDQDSFAHGQVYTALSRTSGWHNIFVVLPAGDSHIANKVHRHFL